MDERTILNMRSRVEMCRSLARSTSDQARAKTLLQMAAEGEADIKRLEVERDGKR